MTGTSAVASPRAQYPVLIPGEVTQGQHRHDTSSFSGRGSADAAGNPSSALALELGGQKRRCLSPNKFSGDAVDAQATANANAKIAIVIVRIVFDGTSPKAMISIGTTIAKPPRIANKNRFKVMRKFVARFRNLSAFFLVVPRVKLPSLPLFIRRGSNEPKRSASE
ncbi:hypothetical protein J7T55_011043 [Diaporthe amygdali]|uniref:uncharacterized protein n=1 Tax=Phomopsis amygdali TaxID=1214568 RepID=UPI0022FDC6BB|nr:uncharacterized protein J7T55_011043 [Diaporthe amygdali]KAJ0106948.1 hypothetical protein J7T55_011043 [Diaporthe amygdali]